MMISLLTVILSLSVSFSFAQEANVSGVMENRKGIEALKKQNPAQAQQHFLQALSKNPLDARLQLNLGYSFEQQGQMDKAKAAYDTAAQLGKDKEALFVANFNRGVLYQKEKKREEALAAYQEALKYKEDSIEAKTNIELLTQDQQGKGQDKGQDKENKDKQDGNKGSDSKDQEGNQKGEDKKDEKTDQDKQDGDQKQEENKPKQYQKNKPQPKPFKSEELTQGDVNKILGEIKQQEQKIRAEFNKRDVKDKGREKDW